MNLNIVSILFLTVALFQVCKAVNRKGIGEPCSNREFWSKVQLKSPEYKANTFNSEEVPQWKDEEYKEYNKSGNRDLGEKMMYARHRDRLGILVLHECVKNNSKYMEKIEEYLDSLCEQPTWVFAAHDKEYLNYNKTYFLDLAAAEISSTIGQIYYMLGDKLSTKIKQKINKTLYERVYEPMSRTFPLNKSEPILKHHQWWYEGSTNWNAVVWSGVVSAALPVIEDKNVREIYVEKALVYAKNYLKSFEPDGFGTESVGYFNYAFSNFILLRQLILEATNGTRDLFKDEPNNSKTPKVIDCALYGIEFPMNEKSSAYFGDAKFALKAEDRKTFDAGILNYIRSTFDSSHVGARFENSFLIDSFLGEVVGYNLKYNPKVRYQVSSSEQKKFGSYNLRKYYNVSGVLVCRPSDKASKNKLSATFKLLGGGIKSDGGHNHDDVGTYSIDLNGVMVAGEVGGPESYNATTFDKQLRYNSSLLNSYGHPVPFINGQVQKRNWLLVDPLKPKVSYYDFTDEKDMIIFDMKNAYNNPEIEFLQRNIVFNRGLSQSVIVKDSVKFNKKLNFETALVSKGKWTELSKESNTATGKFELDNQIIQVRIQSSSPFNLFKEPIEEYKNAFTRIGIQLNEVTEATVTVTYFP